MFLKIFLIVLALVCIAFIFLGITILIKRKGAFPETHIGKNKNMKKLDIHCASSTDALERKNYKPVKR